MKKSLASRIFGGAMLVAGTSIGAAILAMPIATGLFGFYGTLVVMFLCWAFMYWTGTLILEAALYFPSGASFFSYSGILGKTGVFITNITFLLLFYSLVAAYLSSSGTVIIDALQGFFGISLPPMTEILPLLIFFVPFIYFGLRMVDILNRYMVIAMFLIYVAMILLLLPNVSNELLVQWDARFLLLTFSVVVTSFGYHVIIPTLTTYLDRDAHAVERCLWWGSLLPLVFYVLWELVSLGTIPISGPMGLASGLVHDYSISRLLANRFDSDVLKTLAHSFALLAIITSFIGVAQGLFDFIKDGIKAKGRKMGIVALLLTFAPPMVMVLFFERGFIALLEYAGALVSISLGIMPILVVMKLRKQRHEVHYHAKGGQALLFLGIAFFALVVMIVILKNLGIISFPAQELI